MHEEIIDPPEPTPDWERARRCARVLRAAGHEAWAVGGAVRDHLLGLPVHDVDLCTDAAPEQVVDLFARALTVGSRFGVVVVVDEQDDGHTEVASYRSDRAYVDGRHPSGVDLADQASDVQRRDFTINALLLDPLDGRLRDLVGGRADLRRRILRCIGDPMARLQEDRLRILRGMRFAAHLDLRVDAATERAMRTVELYGVSPERLLQEWCKSLDHAAGWRWVDLLRASPQCAAFGLDRDVLQPYPASAWDSGGGLLVRSVAVLVRWDPPTCAAWFARALPWSRAQRRGAIWLREALARCGDLDAVQTLADMHDPAVADLDVLIRMQVAAGLLDADMAAAWRRALSIQGRRGPPDLPD
ncbi:MAG: CCA tRNA nucleotidyltransferase, partial [Planctomycetota bacterium]